MKISTTLSTRANLFIGIIAVVCLMLSACTKMDNAAESAAKDAAHKAALEWLAILDSGEYAQSWEASADVMRNALTLEQFERTFSAVLKPLGAMESRKLKSATYTTQLPGAPDGQYVILRFKTSFANKKQAIETVTPAKGEDGSWKVSGYFIR